MSLLAQFFEGRGIDHESVAVLERAESGFHTTTFGSFLRKIRKIAFVIESVCSPSDRVAILLPQGADAYGAEMAALYSGRVFCPLEPTYPPERLFYCLQDLAPKLVLTDRAGADKFASLNIPIAVVEEVEGPEAVASTVGDQAYIIYTSGSTGLPKGVTVSRRSMSKFLDWSTQYYKVKKADRWAQFSSLGFDLSLVDLLTCMPSGGTLVPVASPLDRMLPGRFVDELSISIWHSVPSVIPLLLRDSDRAGHQLRTLRIASFCGEPLYPKPAASLLSAVPHLSVLNTYGPTEGTFFCSAQVVDSALCAETLGSSLPIGEPIPGWSFEFGHVAGDNELSELIIESDFLSNGYISATPDQSRFGTSKAGTPQYRTGDLVRHHGKHVFFARRADTQVKVRGNRLDLAEVEYHALRSGAREAKAFVAGSSVFLAVSLEEGVTSADLHRELTKHLPKFAVPAEISTFASLPRNANSKIDSKLLREQAVAKWGLRDAEQ